MTTTLVQADSRLALPPLKVRDVYNVIAERFRVRRERVALTVAHREYVRIMRVLPRLARNLHSEFGGKIVLDAHAHVEIGSGGTQYVIVAEAL